MRFASITLSALAVSLAVSLAFPAMAEAPTGIPEFDQLKAHAYCADEWTKRGVLNMLMFDDCMKGQRDSHAEAILMLDKYPSRFVEVYPGLFLGEYPGKAIREVIPYAADQWLKPRKYNFRMFAHELERQGEAMLNIAYAMDHNKFSTAELELCIMQWIRPGEPVWTMVDYCLEEGH